MFKSVLLIIPFALGVSTQKDADIAALISQVAIQPDFEGFGILLNDSLAQQQDIWDDSAWNTAVTNWNNASKNWKKTQFAEVDADQQDIWDDSAWNTAVTNWNNASKNWKKTQFAEVGTDQQDIWDDSAWNAAVTSWNNASKNWKKTQFAEVDADQQDIWDDSAWNTAVTNWNNASKNWKKTQFVQADSELPLVLAQYTQSSYTSTQVGDLIDQMLEELESYGINDPKLIDFDQTWTNYLLKKFNYKRPASSTVQVINQGGSVKPDDSNINSM